MKFINGSHDQTAPVPTLCKHNSRHYFSKGIIISASAKRLLMSTRKVFYIVNLIDSMKHEKHVWLILKVVVCLLFNTVVIGWKHIQYLHLLFSILAKYFVVYKSIYNVNLKCLLIFSK